MDPRTNPYVVVLSRSNTPYISYFCANHAMALRFAGVLGKGLGAGEMVTIRENV